MIQGSVYWHGQSERFPPSDVKAMGGQGIFQVWGTDRTDAEMGAVVKSDFWAFESRRVPMLVHSLKEAKAVWSDWPSLLQVIFQNEVNLGLTPGTCPASGCQMPQTASQNIASLKKMHAMGIPCVAPNIYSPFTPDGAEWLETWIVGGGPALVTEIGLHDYVGTIEQMLALTKTLKARTGKDVFWTECHNDPIALMKTGLKVSLFQLADYFDFGPQGWLINANGKALIQAVQGATA